MFTEQCFPSTIFDAWVLHLLQQEAIGDDVEDMIGWIVIGDLSIGE